MKQIVIPADVMQRVLDTTNGSRTVLPVKVSWPELRLTDDQMFANAVAHSKGRTEPYPDPSYIELVFERP